jgi:predicted MFS family arabinose efflux permease
MIRKIVQLYKSAYGGLSRSTWLLATIMLINRSGAMVHPFLSVYLTQHLDFSLEDTGFILSTYGLGSVCGALIGGRLTDRIGQYKVQFFSLLGSASVFFVVLSFDSFWQMAAGIFTLSLVMDSFRPANSAAVALYSDSQTRTRAYSLNRLAINLGFSIGPAAAGFLAAINYSLLFVVDGLTSLMAAIFFRVFFRAKDKAQKLEQAKETKSLIKSRSAYADKLYLVFVFLTTLNAVCFFQFFSTLSIYFKTVHFLSETDLGLLMSLNGLLVVITEMLLIYSLGEKVKSLNIISIGSLMIALAYGLLNLSQGFWMPIVCIILLTAGEILTMSYLNAFAVSRAPADRTGQYMGLFVLAYSTANIFGPLVGTYLAGEYGYRFLWYVVATGGIFNFLGFRQLNYWLCFEKKSRSEKTE